MDIPLPEDIQFPGDEEPPAVTASTEDVCNIQLPEKAEGELIETTFNVDNSKTSNECYDAPTDVSGCVEISVLGEMESTLQYSDVEEVKTNISNDVSCVNAIPMDEDIPVEGSVDETTGSLPLSNKEVHPKDCNNLPNQQTPSLPSNPMTYSAAAAASYMQYDPSMMSHNYSYMTANNYSTPDYVSFFNNQQRMTAAGSYATAYHPYQSYNHYPYATTALQQMYDGRNINAYTNANYAQQILPQNPPLPPGQPITANTFNPPLPTDYQTSAFPTAATTTTVPSVESEESGALENVTSDKVVQENHTKTQNKKQEDNTEGVAAQPSANASSLTIESVDQSVDDVNKKSITDRRTVAENALSEDVNRYSPSVPMEEDENSNQLENAELQSRPAKVSSVLGKAQAKKRLMAFSISKQAVAAQIAAKKQAQMGIKERRDNEDADAKANTTEIGRSSSEIRESGFGAVSGVFDEKHSKRKHSKKATKMEKARETMEEIEEMKRNELMVRDNSTLYRQALINDNSDMDSRRNNDGDRRKDRSSRRKSRSRSRRRSRSRSRERDRKSKHDDSKKKRRRSRTRSLSRTKSRSRSGSQQRGDKSKIRASELKSWGHFKEAGFQLDRYRRIKFKENKYFLVSEIDKRKKEVIKNVRRHRSRSKERRSASIEKEVIEEIRKRKMNMFDIPMELKPPVMVCPDDQNLSDKFLEFPSHIMQYTNARPVVKYCENVKLAKLHFISRIQLLDSVPDDILILMKHFWNSLRSKRLKTNVVRNNENTVAEKGVKKSDNEEKKEGGASMEWWPKSPLYAIGNCCDTDFDIEEEETEEHKEMVDIGQNNLIETNNTRDFLRNETATGDFTSRGGDDESFASSATIHGDNGTFFGVAATKSGTSTTVVATAPTISRKSRFEDITDEEKVTDVSVVIRSKWDSDYEDSPKRSDSILAIDVALLPLPTTNSSSTKYSNSGGDSVDNTDVETSREETSLSLMEGHRNHCRHGALEDINDDGGSGADNDDDNDRDTRDASGRRITGERSSTSKKHRSSCTVEDKSSKRRSREKSGYHGRDDIKRSSKSSSVTNDWEMVGESEMVVHRSRRSADNMEHDNACDVRDESPTNIRDSDQLNSNNDRKLVTEYEEFLKMVSVEAPKCEKRTETASTLLYEGPKPPPQFEGQTAVLTHESPPRKRESNERNENDGLTTLSTSTPASKLDEDINARLTEQAYKNNEDRIYTLAATSKTMSMILESKSGITPYTSNVMRDKWSEGNNFCGVNEERGKDGEVETKVVDELASVVAVTSNADNDNGHNREPECLRKRKRNGSGSRSGGTGGDGDNEGNAIDEPLITKKRTTDRKEKTKKKKLRIKRADSESKKDYKYKKKRKADGGGSSKKKKYEASSSDSSSDANDSDSEDNSLSNRSRSGIASVVKSTATSAASTTATATIATTTTTSSSSSSSNSSSSSSSSNSSSSSSTSSRSSSSSSSTSSSSSSSDNDSSAESGGRKKRGKRSSKKTKAKRNKRKSVGGEGSASASKHSHDKRKRKSKKKQQKSKGSDVDGRSRKRKKSSKLDEGKRMKLRKLPPDDILELLTETWKKKTAAAETIDDETFAAAAVAAAKVAGRKSSSREKHGNKSKKKRSKDRKDKTAKARTLFELMVSEMGGGGDAQQSSKSHAPNAAVSVGDECFSEMTKSEKSWSEKKKKKKKAKKRHDTNDRASSEEPGRRKKKNDKLTQNDHNDSTTVNVSNTATAATKTTNSNSFFEENLDDWNESETVESTAVRHSMRDYLATETADVSYVDEANVAEKRKNYRRRRSSNEISKSKSSSKKKKKDSKKRKKNSGRTSSPKKAAVTAAVEEKKQRQLSSSSSSALLTTDSTDSRNVLDSGDGVLEAEPMGDRKRVSLVAQYEDDSPHLDRRQSDVSTKIVGIYATDEAERYSPTAYGSEGDEDEHGFVAVTAESSSVLTQPSAADANEDPQRQCESKQAQISDDESVCGRFTAVDVSVPTSKPTNFTMGKLEVRTKAAKKFVHSNIFDSFDYSVEERESNVTGAGEPPCRSENTSNYDIGPADALSKREVSLSSLRQPLTETTTTTMTTTMTMTTTTATKNAAQHCDKEEFLARPCIALPDITFSSSQVIDAVAFDNEACSSKDKRLTSSDRRENDDCRDHENTNKRSSRRKNNDSKMDGRRRSLSIDRYRKRRRKEERRTGKRFFREGRTRSRSRSRSVGRKRAKDYYYPAKKRDRRKSRSRSRSRSRSISRSRSRSLCRSRSRSVSRDAAGMRRRQGNRSFESTSNDNYGKRDKSPITVSTPEGNSSDFHHILGNIKTEKDERRTSGAGNGSYDGVENKFASEIEKIIGDGLWRRGGGSGCRSRDPRDPESRKMNDHLQRQQQLQQQRGAIGMEYSSSSSQLQRDRLLENGEHMDALHEKLFQLKESLWSLNENGVSLDTLRNTLAMLDQSGGGSPCVDLAADKTGELKRIVNLCRAIRNTYPSGALFVNDPTTSTTTTPTPPPPLLTVNCATVDAAQLNRTYKGNRSVAEPANAYKSTFAERSREISPKPLSLDERLELELGMKPTAVVTTASLPVARTAIGIPPHSGGGVLPVHMSAPPPNYYPIPMYDNAAARVGAAASYTSIPPPPQAMHHPYAHLMPPNADRNYYGGTAVDWNMARGVSTASVPPSHTRSHISVLPAPHQTLSSQSSHRLVSHQQQQQVQPQHQLQHQHQSKENQSYRIADAVGSKVHSIQVGNVLQIVPTELQLAPPLSSPSVSSHHFSKKQPQQQHQQQQKQQQINSHQTVANNVVNSDGFIAGNASSMGGFSSMLTASIPVSFAAAPAVSGSKTNSSSHFREPSKGSVSGETKSKSKDPPPPPPPGTPDKEVKRLMRLAKEKRREERALQKLLKLKNEMQTSPSVTPNGDEFHNYGGENTDESEESNASISIKPSPEQGILISPGFKEKSTPVTPLGRTIIGSARKMVSFVDGIRPGSTSLNDSPVSRTRKPSPPPNVKKKHKVRVKIIRATNDESSDDDTPPPPPPPGPPPPDLYPPSCAAANSLPSGFILPKL